MAGPLLTFLVPLTWIPEYIYIETHWLCETLWQVVFFDRFLKLTLNSKGKGGVQIKTCKPILEIIVPNFSKSVLAVLLLNYCLPSRSWLCLIPATPTRKRPKPWSTFIETIAPNMCTAQTQRILFGVNHEWFRGWIMCKLGASRK